MTNKQMLSVEREMLERWTAGRVSLSHLAEMRSLLDKEVDGNSHAPKHQGVPPLIATLHENGELIAAQATIAQQAKLIELLKGKGQGDPVALLSKGFTTLESEGGKYRIITAYQNRDDAWSDYKALCKAEQPAMVVKSRCDQVPFSMLCYGAKFKYTPGESAVFVKIGPDLVAGWDGQKVADGWIGQPVCSLSDDGNLLAVVTLVHEQAAPVAVVMPEKKSVPEPEDYNTNIDEVAFAEGYNDALDDVARLNVVKP